MIGPLRPTGQLSIHRFRVQRLCPLSSVNTTLHIFCPLNPELCSLPILKIHATTIVPCRWDIVVGRVDLLEPVVDRRAVENPHNLVHLPTACGARSDLSSVIESISLPAGHCYEIGLQVLFSRPSLPDSTLLCSDRLWPEFVH